MSAQIATTNWGLVFAARTDDPVRRQEALAALYRLYWYPLYAFVRRRGQPHDEATDLVQAFFVHVIEHEAFGGVDPSLGRFRTFLLVALKNFLANEHDRRRAKRRGGEVPHVSIDADATGHRYESIRDTDDPEQLFQRQWALTVLDRALQRLRARYESGGRVHEFEVLSPHLTSAATDATPAAVAQALGASEAALRTALHRLRRRFGEALRAEVAETVADANDVDAELRFLFAALKA